MSSSMTSKEGRLEVPSTVPHLTWELSSQESVDDGDDDTNDGGGCDDDIGKIALPELVNRFDAYGENDSDATYYSPREENADKECHLILDTLTDFETQQKINYNEENASMKTSIEVYNHKKSKEDNVRIIYETEDVVEVLTNLATSNEHFQQPNNLQFQHAINTVKENVIGNVGDSNKEYDHEINKLKFLNINDTNMEHQNEDNESNVLIETMLNVTADSAVWDDDIIAALEDSGTGPQHCNVSVPNVSLMSQTVDNVFSDLETSTENPPVRLKLIRKESTENSCEWMSLLISEMEEETCNVGILQGECVEIGVSPSSHIIDTTNNISHNSSKSEIGEMKNGSSQKRPKRIQGKKIGAKTLPQRKKQEHTASRKSVRFCTKVYEMSDSEYADCSSRRYPKQKRKEKFQHGTFNKLKTQLRSRLMDIKEQVFSCITGQGEEVSKALARKLMTEVRILGRRLVDLYQSEKKQSQQRDVIEVKQVCDTLQKQLQGIIDFDIRMQLEQQKIESEDINTSDNEAVLALSSEEQPQIVDLESSECSSSESQEYDEDTGVQANLSPQPCDALISDIGSQEEEMDASIIHATNNMNGSSKVVVANQSVVQKEHCSSSTSVLQLHSVANSEQATYDVNAKKKFSKKDYNISSFSPILRQNPAPKKKAMHKILTTIATTTQAKKRLLNKSKLSASVNSANKNLNTSSEFVVNHSVVQTGCNSSSSALQLHSVANFGQMAPNVIATENTFTKHGNISRSSPIMQQISSSKKHATHQALITVPLTSMTKQSCSINKEVDSPATLQLINTQLEQNPLRSLKSGDNLQMGDKNYVVVILNPADNTQGEDLSNSEVSQSLLKYHQSCTNKKIPQQKRQCSQPTLKLTTTTDNVHKPELQKVVQPNYNEPQICAENVGCKNNAAQKYKNQGAIPKCIILETQTSSLEIDSQSNKPTTRLDTGTQTTQQDSNTASFREEVLLLHSERESLSQVNKHLPPSNSSGIILRNKIFSLKNLRLPEEHEYIPNTPDHEAFWRDINAPWPSDWVRDLEDW